MSQFHAVYSYPSKKVKKMNVKGPPKKYKILKALAKKSFTSGFLALPGRALFDALLEFTLNQPVHENAG